MQGTNRLGRGRYSLNEERKKFVERGSLRKGRNKVERDKEPRGLGSEGTAQMKEEKDIGGLGLGGKYQRHHTQQ